MKRTLDTYREYLHTGREYEEKIVYLEQKVHQLESANKILNEFSLNSSNIIFKMDCLLVKKGEKISSLMEQIENLSKIRKISETDTHEPEIIGRSRSNSEVKGQIKLEFAREDDENLISEAHIARDTQKFHEQNFTDKPEKQLLKMFLMITAMSRKLISKWRSSMKIFLKLLTSRIPTLESKRWIMIRLSQMLPECRI